jgi:hypothetical protein
LTLGARAGDNALARPQRRDSTMFTISRSWLPLVELLLAASASVVQAAPTALRPNIVWIMADDND